MTVDGIDATVESVNEVGKIFKEGLSDATYVNIDF
jgi:hypothetical protein